MGEKSEYIKNDYHLRGNAKNGTYDFYQDWGNVGQPI